MWIIDLTKLLSEDHINYYVFNPSVICIESDKLNIDGLIGTICIMVYRVASYDINQPYHPWKIWDNGYKIFMNPEKVINEKYRDILGGPLEVQIRTQKLSQKTIEYDSTGLAIFVFDGKEFSLKYNMPNLFKDE